jgi:hypothetical protein
MSKPSRRALRSAVGFVAASSGLLWARPAAAQG